MASVWGSSWGPAWGNAWGRVSSGFVPSIPGLSVGLAPRDYDAQWAGEFDADYGVRYDLVIQPDQVTSATSEAVDRNEATIQNPPATLLRRRYTVN